MSILTALPSLNWVHGPSHLSPAPIIRSKSNQKGGRRLNSEFYAPHRPLEVKDFRMVFDAFFWSAYPPCSNYMCIFPISFLNVCSSLASQNPCWCPNTSWLSSIASCVGSRCPSELSLVYSTLQANCLANGGFQIGITSNEWQTASQSLPPAPVLSGLSPSGWSAYPACSRYVCLLPDVYENPCSHIGNVCTCRNVTEIEEWAKCIGSNCPSEVGQVYNTALSNCNSNGGYSVAVSLDDFLSVAEGGKPVATTYTPIIPTSIMPTSIVPTGTVSVVNTRVQTSTSLHITTLSPTDTTQPSANEDGLSRSDDIALGVGLGMGLPALVIGLAALWVGWKTYKQRIVEIGARIWDRD
jgi:hypothetical protein